MRIEDVIREFLREVVRDELKPLVERLEGIATPNALPSSSPYLSTEEAATLAGVRVETIRRWISAGQLPGHRAGRLTRVRRDRLEAFLAKKPAAMGVDVGAIVARILAKKSA